MAIGNVTPGYPVGDQTDWAFGACRHGCIRKYWSYRRHRQKNC